MNLLMRSAVTSEPHMGTTLQGISLCSVLTSKLGWNVLERKPGEVGRTGKEGKGRGGQNGKEGGGEGRGLRGVSGSQRTPTSLIEHLET